MRTSLLVLVLMVPVAVAQPNDPPKPKPLSYTLTVRPAAEAPGPVPMPLLPLFRERVHGNAAIYYHRAFGHRKHAEKELRKIEDELFDQLEKEPRKKFAGAAIEDYLKRNTDVFRELDAAVNCSFCDWQLETHLNDRGIGVVMEEVQQCRALANTLKLRVRWLLGRGKIDEAVRDIRTGITLGRHVGEGPTIIVNLVGNAIEAVMLGELMQVMQAPGSPNFYRALAVIPQPFFRGDAVVEGEQRMMESTLKIQRLDGRHVSHAEALRVLAHCADVEQASGPNREPLNDTEREKAAALTKLMIGKALPNLRQQGFTDDELKNLTETQVVALELTRRMRSRHEEVMQSLRLPYPEAIAYGKMLDRRYRDDAKDRDFVDVMNQLLLPAATKIVGSRIRLDRQITMLRTIEAVRLYAAEHGGKLPAKLADAAERVSLPSDPATGKPYEYRATGKTFTLTAPPYDEAAPSVANSVVFTVTVEP